MSLQDRFLAHVADAEARQALAARADLEQELGRIVEKGRAAWPAIALGEETFVVYLAERLPPGAEAAGALGATHAGDLYLACACTRGDRTALATLDSEFMRDVATYLARDDALGGFTDEVRQTLRARLLVAEEGLVPRLGRYSGRGPLHAWLRTAAVRAAVDLRRAEKGASAAAEEEALALVADDADPELGLFKMHAAAELKAAFESTLSKLSAREANIVRLHFLDGVTQSALASLYKVSERTIERWTAQLRRKLLDDTRRRLAERLRLPAAQLDELIQLVQTHLHVSVRKFLKTPPAE